VKKRQFDWFYPANPGGLRVQEKSVAIRQLEHFFGFRRNEKAQTPLSHFCEKGSPPAHVKRTVRHNRVSSGNYFVIVFL
jgi:hypothetical protein